MSAAALSPSTTITKIPITSISHILPIMCPIPAYMSSPCAETTAGNSPTAVAASLPNSRSTRICIVFVLRRLHIRRTVCVSAGLKSSSFRRSAGETIGIDVGIGGRGVTTHLRLKQFPEALVPSVSSHCCATRRTWTLHGCVCACGCGARWGSAARSAMARSNATSACNPTRSRWITASASCLPSRE